MPRGSKAPDYLTPGSSLPSGQRARTAPGGLQVERATLDDVGLPAVEVVGSAHAKPILYRASEVDLVAVGLVKRVPDSRIARAVPCVVPSASAQLIDGDTARAVLID